MSRCPSGDDEWAFLAVTSGYETLGADASLGEVMHDRLRTTLGEALIIACGAVTVSVSEELDTCLGIVT